MSWILGLRKIILYQEKESTTLKHSIELIPSIYIGSLIYVMVILVSPLNPTKAENLQTISEFGMFILLSVFKRIMLSNLPLSIKILRTKWLATYNFRTRTSWCRSCTFSLSFSLKDISFLLIKNTLFFRLSSLSIFEF